MKAAQSKQTLYQVFVETRDGQAKPVGPAMLKDAADQFAATVRAQIALGREREWFNPHVAQVFNLH